MPASPLQFEKLDGKGVKIGVADTGIDVSHPALEQCVHAGVSLLNTNTRRGREVTPPTTTHIDIVGHGTAVAYIIHKKAPAAQIYNIQILDERLTSSIHRMIEAIDWAIEQNLDILNLSMGSTHLHRKNEVEAAIRRANEANLLVVSACHNHGKQSLPASLPDVFGVVAGALSGRYSYHWEEKSRKFIARGDHQRVAGLNGKYLFCFGSSYAAPHITGIITLIRQTAPRATYSQVLDLLIANALQSDTDDKVPQHLSAALYSRTIRMDIKRYQQQLNSVAISTQADALLNSVKNVVADVLNLSDAEVLLLHSTALLDPVFNLNGETAMLILDTLQRKFNLMIDDEDLSLMDFFSLDSLVKAVIRWQKSSSHSSPSACQAVGELSRR
ncbi:MAG: S8 family serine peptidase [Chloroflexota bacterium]